MHRKIIIYPNKILRTKSKEVEIDAIKTKEIQQVADDLSETMVENNGLGLASPQIGKLLRVIAVSAKEGPLVLINPKIIKRSWRKDIDEEGCLSFPEKFGFVKRPLNISVETYNLNAEKLKFKAEGLFSRVIQHEIDHLDGVLFIDKAKKIKKLKK